MKGRTPTSEEKQWMDAICDIGCIVCLLIFNRYTPGTVHHLDGKEKPGAHKKSICLCGCHHQIASPTGAWATRHGPGRNTGKAAFESAYGTELYLLEHTQKMVEETLKPCNISIMV